MWKLSNLLAHPDWANDHDPVKISTLCKYVLQLINRHHCEWTVSPSYLIDTSLGTSTPSTYGLPFYDFCGSCEAQSQSYLQLASPIQNPYPDKQCTVR